MDDARLVVLNARDAAGRGADIRTRTRAGRQDAGGVWQRTHGRRRDRRAQVLVNAAGPWVSRVLRDVIGQYGARQSGW